jgi:hypothetical protein
MKSLYEKKRKLEDGNNTDSTPAKVAKKEESQLSPQPPKKIVKGKIVPLAKKEEKPQDPTPVVTPVVAEPLPQKEPSPKPAIVSQPSSEQTPHITNASIAPPAQVVIEAPETTDKPVLLKDAPPSLSLEELLEAEKQIIFPVPTISIETQKNYEEKIHILETHNFVCLNQIQTLQKEVETQKEFNYQNRVMHEQMKQMLESKNQQEREKWEIQVKNLQNVIETLKSDLAKAKDRKMDNDKKLEERTLLFVDIANGKKEIEKLKKTLFEANVKLEKKHEEVVREKEITIANKEKNLQVQKRIQDGYLDSISTLQSNLGNLMKEQFTEFENMKRECVVYKQEHAKFQETIKKRLNENQQFAPQPKVAPSTNKAAQALDKAEEKQRNTPLQVFDPDQSKRLIDLYTIGETDK